MYRWCLLFVAALLGGCGMLSGIDDLHPSAEDKGGEAGTPSNDSGMPADASVENREAAGPTDAGFDRDTSLQPDRDGGGPDINVSEGRAPDMSSPDMSSPDMSAPDMSAPDMSAPDMSVADIGVTDRGTIPDLTTSDATCSPGATQCSGNSVQTCGTDGTWGNATPCPGGFCNGAGICGVCASGSLRCSGNDVQTCGADGQWGTAVACASQACLAGACTGSCTPGTTQCSGNGVQTCASNGTWGGVTPCSNQACVNGTCTGTCNPGATQCSGNGVQTCSASGAWGTASACSGGFCNGAGICGVCAAGSTQCSSNGVQTCSAAGQWGTPAACNNQACVSGACTGTCAPGALRCSGNGVETCGSTGSWGTAAACAGGFCNGAGICGVCATGTTQCAGSNAQTCDASGQWGAAMSCPTAQTCLVGQCRPIATTTAPSCQTTGAGRTNCGPGGNENCCKSLLVPAGTFFRYYDPVYVTSKDAPATIGDFRLDAYEVTVGRFRAFVTSGKGSQASPPAAGAGAHPRIPNSGWNSAWNSSLVAGALNLDLKCSPTLASWTDTAGANENRPINCVTWYEAFAFCASDGGRLPTEAEWNYTAQGGEEQRLFPWGALVPDNNADLAAWGCFYGGGSGTDGVCASIVSLAPVGMIPAGNGRWGHSDLVGNLNEWELDYNGVPLPLPCVDCAQLTPNVGTSSDERIFNGGDFSITNQLGLFASRRWQRNPIQRDLINGFRCARSL